MSNSSKSRLIALLVAVLLPSLAQAQGPPLPDQTTIVNSQQITVYDATLPERERNRRITVGLLRSGLGGGGGSDGVLTGLIFSGLTLTSTLSTGPGPTAALPDVIAQALNAVTIEFDTTTRVFTFTGGQADGSSFTRTATIPGGGTGTADGVLETLTLSAANLLTAGLTIGSDVTVDLSSLAGGSGGGGTPSIFKAQLTDVDISQADSTTFTQYLDIAANDVEINTGSYTMISDANGRERICVPTDGYYEIASDVAVFFADDPVERGTIRMHYTIRASGSTLDVEQPEESRQYNRGEYDGVGRTSLSSNELTAIYLLSAGDCIGTQTRIEQDARTYTVQGDPSFIEVVRLDGGPGSGTVVVGNPGGSGADLATLGVDGVTFTVPSGGGSDGVATGGVYNSGAGRIDFSVSAPGSAFNVSGIGDITAIQVGTTSGLSGGGQSGSVSLFLNPFGMTTAGTLQSSYVLPIGRGSLDARKATLTTLADFMCAGTGLSASNGVCSATGGGGDITEVSTPNLGGLAGGGDAGTVALRLDVSNLETRNDLEGSDRLPFMNDSDTNDETRGITVENLCGHLAGSNLTCDSEGELSASGGVGGGDITAVVTAANSGLIGGCTVGDCFITLAPQNLPNFGTAALHRSDTVIIRDDSDATVKGIGVDDWFAGHAGPHLSVVPGVNPQLQVSSGGAAAGQYFQADGAGGAIWSFVDLSSRLTPVDVKPWTLDGSDRPDAVDLATFTTGLNEGFAFSTSGRDTPFQFRALVGAPSGRTGGGILGITDGGAVENVQGSTSGHVLTFQNGDYVFAAPTGGGGSGSVVTATGNPVSQITIDGTSHTILVPERWAGPAWMSVDMPPRAMASNTPTNGQFLSFAGGTSGVWRSLGAARTGFTGQGVLAFGGSNSVVTAISGNAGQFLGVDSSGLPDYLFFGAGIATTFDDNCAMVTESNDWQCLEPATVNHVLTNTASGIAWAASQGGGGGTPGTREVLFDNTDPTDTALTGQSGPGGWNKTVDLGLGRELIAADDDMNLRIRLFYTQDNQIRLLNLALNAGDFRVFDVNDLQTGVTTFRDGYHVFDLADGRTSRTLSNTFGRLGMLTRGNVSGQDVARILFNITNNSVGAISAIRGTVALEPVVGVGGGGGGGGLTAAEVDARIDTRVASGIDGAVPSGGATDQFLTKASGTDFDVQWQTRNIPLASTDADINWQNPQNEPTDRPPSRQSVAEAVSEARNASGGSRDSFAVATPGDLPVANNTIVGNQYYVMSTGFEYVAINDAHTQTEPDGTFNAISARSDLSVVTSLPNASNQDTGDYAYLDSNPRSGGQAFYQVTANFTGVKEWTQVHPGAALAASRTSTSQTVVWLGAEDTSAEALEFTYTVDADHDYFWLDGSTIKILDQSTFASAGQVVNHYRLVAVNDNSGGGGGGITASDLAGDGLVVDGERLSVRGVYPTASSTNIEFGDRFYFNDVNSPQAPDKYIERDSLQAELVSGGRVRAVLSLTTVEQNNLLVGATLSGGNLLFTHNDGNTSTVDLPSVAGRVQTITCDSASGLDCSRSGDTVDAQLDVQRLFEATTVEGSDEIPIADDSVGSDPTRKATLVSVSNFLAEGNLVADGQGHLYTAVNENATRTTLEGGDWFIFGDAEDVEDRKITVENVGQHFADGSTIVHDPTTGVLSIPSDVFLPGQARTTTSSYAAAGDRIATNRFVVDVPGLGEVGQGGNDGLDGLDLFQVYNHIGGNQVPRQKLTWTGLKEALADELVIPLPDDSVTQDKLADMAVGIPQLKTGTGSELYTMNGTQNLNRMSFTPVVTVVTGYDMDSDGVGCRITNIYGQDGGSGLIPKVRHIFSAGRTCRIDWEYMTASDTPSVWVLLDGDGVVAALWESEDPAGPGSPISLPDDDAGNVLPGFSTLDIGLPTFSVIEQVYSDGLTAAQRDAMLTCTSDYLLMRGWTDGPLTNLVDYIGVRRVSDRYEPSARQWMMRCGAQAAGVGAPTFYLNHLVVSGGAWARPTQ